LPEAADVAPLLEPLSLCVELPLDAELPRMLLEAVAPVESEADVLFEPLLLLAVEVSVVDADLFALLVSDKVVAYVELLLALSVSASVLLEFAA